MDPTGSSERASRGGTFVVGPPAPRLRSGKWHAHRKDLRDQRMKRVVLLVALGASLGLPTAAVADGGPVGATARCRDGTYSFSRHHQGACSHHRGVAEWLEGSAASSQSPTRRAAPTTSASGRCWRDGASCPSNEERRLHARPEP